MMMLFSIMRSREFRNDARLSLASLWLSCLIISKKALRFLRCSGESFVKGASQERGLFENELSGFCKNMIAIKLIPSCKF